MSNGHGNDNKKTEIHIHLPSVNISGLENRLDIIQKQLEVIMAKVDDLLADLKEANATTDEIANDVDVLLSKLVAGGLTAAETTQVQSEIAALKTRLQGVAAKYTPDVTVSTIPGIPG